jgi:hypothetical protein
MAKSPFGGGLGRRPAPTSAFGSARPRKPRLGAGPMGPSVAPANPMAGGIPGGAIAAPGGMGDAPAFSHGGGVQGGAMRGYKCTMSSHDCPALHSASKANTTRALCRGGRS